jgi:hypothetical protein
MAVSFKPYSVCKVRIHAPETEAAMRTAHNLLRIFGECGFPSAIRTTERPAAVLHVESHLINAPMALAIQSAFRRGGFDAVLSVEEAVNPGEILIWLGPEGL